MNTGFIGSIEGHFYKTTNGGVSWFDISPSDSIGGLIFFNENTGFLSSGNSLYKSVNGGINWTRILYSYLSYYGGIVFPDNNTGYMLNQNFAVHRMYFLKSTNSGNNWFMLSESTDLNNPTDLSYIDVNNVYQLINRYNPQRSLLNFTTDGGYTWDSLIISSNYFFSSMYFINIQTGYLCGEYGNIYKTTNKGLSWVNQTQGVGGARLVRIFFTNQNTGYTIGDQGVIKKTTTGGEPIGIHQLSNNSPDNYCLFQNYPNPFNPTTKIKFDIPASMSPLYERGVGGFISLKLFDLLGREVATLVNEQLNPGTPAYRSFGAGRYEVSWDGSNYPSGVYFYTLTAGDYSETRKMVLIK